MRPDYRWRFFVCDRSGQKLSLLKNASARKVSPRRNRPGAFTFKIPSDDYAVAVRLTDGFPILAKQVRTVRGYRYEGADGYPAIPGAGSWVIRGAWIVWQIEDDGDEEGNGMSIVTCYSPLIMLDKMPPTAPGTQAQLVFDGIDAGIIIGTVLGNANTVAQNSGAF